jgi:hypothetical protein
MYGHVQHGEELNRPNPVRKEFLRTTSLRILNIDGLNNLKYVASARSKFSRILQTQFYKTACAKKTLTGSTISST